ncbi:hypothetical protein E2986_13036 [Frieseomelitta varia]|uniref:ADP,ATP carrier protein n=1 Tax=Frieseomelitta varia TaxID=561572 RepID=A0A833VUS6_9HYME|nr:hypothetical protein E2986_13036 [Frieseomelitta varia]
MEIFYRFVSNEHDNSIFRQISTIIEKDGSVGFYRGVSANLISAVCGSLILVTYDIIKERFNQLMEPKSDGEKCHKNQRDKTTIEIAVDIVLSKWRQSPCFTLIGKTRVWKSQFTSHIRPVGIV